MIGKPNYLKVLGASKPKGLKRIRKKKVCICLCEIDHYLQFPCCYFQLDYIVRCHLIYTLTCLFCYYYHRERTRYAIYLKKKEIGKTTWESRDKRVEPTAQLAQSI